MIDIDNFKQVNDEHGHQQGDEVLAHVAEVLRDLSRDIDAPARYGGEELAVILPQTDLEGATLLAERMRDAIEPMRVPRVAAAASCGSPRASACRDAPERGRQGLLVAAADAALYRAKRGGKNRVERAQPWTPREMA